MSLFAVLVASMLAGFLATAGLIGGAMWLLWTEYSEARSYSIERNPPEVTG